MRGGADGVAHVGQAIEERDEIVLARIVFGGGHLEAYAIGDSGLPRALGGRVDRRAMVVEPVKLGLRERLGEDDRRRAMSATDVRDGGSRLQPLADPLERGDPRPNE